MWFFPFWNAIGINPLTQTHRYKECTHILQQIANALINAIAISCWMDLILFTTIVNRRLYFKFIYFLYFARYHHTLCMLYIVLLTVQCSLIQFVTMVVVKWVDVFACAVSLLYLISFGFSVLFLFFRCHSLPLLHPLTPTAYICHCVLFCFHSIVPSSLSFF